MKKRICFMWGICLFLTLLYAPLCEASTRYVSFEDIKAEVSEFGRWNKAYDVRGRDIVVDIDVNIPEVDEVPIMKVGFADDLQPYNTALYNDDSRYGEILTIAQSSATSWNGDGSAYTLPLTTDHAENSPLSPKEAKDFAEELVSLYKSQIDHIEIQFQGQVTWSRKYQRIKQDSEYVGIDLEKPVTDMGCYEIKYHQLFHGIPYIVGGYYAINAKGDDHQRPLGIIEALIASKEDYLLDFFPAQEIGVCLDDVPLAPFSDVITAFEEWINAGLIRDAYELRFGYMIYDDPNDFAKTFFLLPVWELRGVIMQDAMQETPDFSNDILLCNQRLKAMSVVVDAQSGELLDPFHNKNSDRQLVKHIITWNEVN